MMAFIKLQPLQSYIRSVRVGHATIPQRCSRLPFWLPRGLRFTSHLHKSADAEKLLTQQRLNRPVSPHLSIYRPQITWIVSICTRITGFALASGMYLFATAYLLSPVTGWNMSSEFLVTKFSSLSPVAKFALKLGVALPFTFHCFNGTRHLVWDAGRALSNKQVVRSGWIVVGASGIAAVLLASRQPCDDTQAG